MPIRDMFNPITPAVLASPPAIPSSTVAAANQTAADCMVYIIGGTVTVIQLTPPGGAASQVGVATPAAILVPSGWSITLTYSVIPTSWVWIPL